MHDTVASRVTVICPIWCFAGQGRCASRDRVDGNLPQDGLISHLIWRIVMYVLTDEAITQRDTLLLLQHLLPIRLE